MPESSAGISRFVMVLTTVVSLAAGVAVWAQGTSQELVTLSVGTPAPLKPGGVALIVVSSPQDLGAVTGEIAGRPVRFWPGASAREWNGLAGIHLDAAPGSATLKIQGTTASGASATARVSLVVERYRYETRQLTVDPKMVNPPENELARIKEETQAMADAFAILTPERLWRGAFDAPVPGAPNSAFGRLTITNGKPAGRHQGADFRVAAPLSQVIDGLNDKLAAKRVELFRTIEGQGRYSVFDLSQNHCFRHMRSSLLVVNVSRNKNSTQRRRGARTQGNLCGFAPLRLCVESFMVGNCKSPTMKA